MSNSNSSDVSNTESNSPQHNTDNSPGSPNSPRYGIIENSSSSSDGETPGVRTILLEPNTSFDLTAGDWQPGFYRPNDSEAEESFPNLRRFCSNISSSFFTLGLNMLSPITNNNNRRRRRPSQVVPDRPLELIDLCNIDDSPPPRSARARVPDAFIDLCTPDASSRENRAADPNPADESFVRPRRRVSRNAMRNSTSATNNQAEPAVSPPKKQKKDTNLSSDLEKSIEEDPYKCPVCLENVRKREPSSTKCGHIFCKVCIEGAIKTTHKCPLCNLKINMKSIFRIYL